ncbi:hypothetical protein P4O66_015989, partial [Electrophorus voltai]
MVLFTFGDYLRDTLIEQHIESEGKNLQWLVEKCGNRYHVLNIKNRGDDTQVTELLEKIEEMVAANRGYYFKKERKRADREEKDRRAEEERAKERRMEVQKQREDITAVIEQEMTEDSGSSGCHLSDHPQPTKSLLMSVFIPEMGENHSEDRNSNTYRFLCPHAGQFQCKITNIVFEMEGKGEVLYRIVSWDTRLLDGLGHMQPAGPLYEIDCCEEEHQVELAVARFTGENLEELLADSIRDATNHLSELRIVFLAYIDGNSSARNTTLGREEFELKRTAQCMKRDGEVAEQHIESEDSALQWLVEKCGNRYHVLNNENSGDDTQVTELLEKLEEMVAANSGCCFEMEKRALEETAKERMLKLQNQREHIRAVMGEHTERVTPALSLRPIALPIMFYGAGLMSLEGPSQRCFVMLRYIWLRSRTVLLHVSVIPEAARATHHLSELRIVLLGYRYAGKSSAGNTILGREEFGLKRTAQCVMRQGEVTGRKITVVKAPGWGINKPVEHSSELLKQEISLSVSLCPPGPHVLLLVLHAGTTFKERERRVLDGHMKLFTERVWSHTIVLFIYGDRLGDITIAQHIKSKDSALQWVVEKCGNRYHVLSNENSGDDTQVTELLEKIEEMVAANSGCCFEMEKKILQELEERRRAEEERAKERMMIVHKQREDIRAVMGKTQHLSELRIILLGYRYSGKSSAGNTILDRKEFELERSAQCVKRKGKVAGKKITVVEAPGWWINKPVEESSELLKEEIVLSMSLCPPGPHVLLLVLRVDTIFKVLERKILVGHMKLLTERVWSHTIVLFTCGDRLGDKPIEQCIESEGKALQWLAEKCGNRYHVLNNKNSGDDTQVTELLEKIEEMVAANSGCCFEMDRKILQEVEERSRIEKERAKKRMMKVEKQAEDSVVMGDTQHLSELRIVLLGYRHAGKSSAGNTILGREEFELKQTAQCVKRKGAVAGRWITVVEAPGWWRNGPVEQHNELLKEEIVHSVSLCSPGPHVLLLVLRVCSAFKEHDRRVLERHMRLFTERVWSHTLVLFTYGDCLGDTPTEHHIESEDSALQWLVEKCGNRYHVLNNKNRGDGTQVTELLEKIEDMVADNRGCHFEMDRKAKNERGKRKRAEKKLAKEKVQKQREDIRALN